MHIRDPSADRHKDEESLYKATASFTKHFKAKAGQVSQLLLLWAAHTSVSAYITWNCNGYQEHHFLLPLKINQTSSLGPNAPSAMQTQSKTSIRLKPSGEITKDLREHVPK